MVRTVKSIINNPGG